jgi:tungstate transport system substrate-binding protein
MFLIVGPPDDPAGIRDMRSAVAALRRIDSLGAPFVSRGDHSGTHLRELELWRRAGVTAPAGVWYMESGQGMGQTLQMAEEKRAYVLTDIATYLAWRDRVSLVPLVQGDPALYNVYHVLELNPKNAPRINVAGGRALADFFVAPATQQLIGEFGRRRFRQSLFVPDAGKVDTW